MARIFIIAGVCILLTSAQAQPVNVSSFGAAGTNGLQAYNSSRVLVPGDIVEVKVYQEEDLSARTRVENDGTIALPLLGAVKVSGKTAEQARAQVHELLAKDYLQHPEVSLTVMEGAKRRFCILGEVKQPGYYTIPENEKLTLLQAVSMAGGYTPFAQPKKIRIKRTIGGRESVRIVDAKAMAKKDQVSIVEIEPNDTILVTDQLF